MCFDKTGTLTSDGMELYGVLPASGSEFRPMVTEHWGNTLPLRVLAGMATCHGLADLNG